MELEGEHHETIPWHSPLKIGTLSTILANIADTIVFRAKSCLNFWTFSGERGDPPSFPNFHSGTRLSPKLCFLFCPAQIANVSTASTEAFPSTNSLADEYRQCSGNSTHPRRTGLLWMYSTFCHHIASP